LTASPIQVFVGSVVRTTGNPRRRNLAAVFLATLVFPEPSMPSNVTKLPLISREMRSP
jgi:hypothetical protein